MHRKNLYIFLLIFLLFININASQIYTSIDISLSPANNLGDFLKNYAGINLLSEGDFGQRKTLSMRGTNTENLVIILNEQIINSPRDNITDLNIIPLECIEKIEIITNPNPILYGNNSSGGIIKIYTQNYTASTYVKLNSYWEEFDNKLFNINFSSNYKNLDYYLGVVQKSGLGEQFINTYIGKNYIANFSYKYDSLSNISFTSNAYYNNIKNRIYVDDTTWTYYRIKGEDTYQKIAIHQAWKRDKLNLEISNHGIYDKFDTLLTKEKSSSQFLNLNYEKFLDENISLLLGYELNNKTFLKIDSLKEMQTHASDNSYYFHSQFSFEKYPELSLGYRYFNPDNYADYGMPLVNISHIFDKQLKLNTYYSQNYSIPSFIDVYGDNISQKPATSILYPEHSETFGLDIDIGDKYLLLKLKIYQTNSFNLLALNNNIKTNFPKSYSKNGEVYLNNQFTKNISSEIGYAYTFVKEKISNVYLPYQPQDKITYNLILDKNFFDDDMNIKIKIGGKKVGKSFTDLSNSQILPAYTTVDAKIIMKIIDFNLYYGVSNLYYEKYKTLKDHSMPSHNVSFGFNWEFWE